MESLRYPFIRGMIILWYGAVASIPKGWVLCNGASGTPNLQNVFVVGAGDSYVPGAVGGAANHTHDFVGSGHSHTIEPGSGIQAGTDINNITASESAAGVTQSESTLPPYRALVYIMKI